MWKEEKQPAEYESRPMFMTSAAAKIKVTGWPPLSFLRPNSLSLRRCLTLLVPFFYYYIFFTNSLCFCDIFEGLIKIRGWLCLWPQSKQLGNDGRCS